MVESSASTSTRVSSSSESLTSYSRASTTDRNMRSCSRLQLLALHAEGLGGLVHVRHPAELGGQALLDGLELAGEGAHRAGGPVGGPDGIEDRAPDALGGEAVEGHAPGLVVAAGRLDQAEGAGGGQLLAVDVAGEVHRHLEHHVAHQRQVLLDERVQLSLRPARSSSSSPSP